MNETPTSAGPLAGRTALITGATGGVGRAVATALVDAGVRHLFLTGRSTSALSEVRSLLRGASVGARECDLASSNDTAALAEAALREMGRVDILANVAGVFPVASLASSSIEEFDACFAVNVRAPFILTRRLAPAMAENGWGRVVNIGSSSAYAGFRDTSVYCASKHALLGLSRALFHEWREKNVRVYCISPGSIQTEMGRKVPGQRFETFMRPEEVARFIVFTIAFDNELVCEELRLNRVNRQ